MQTDGLGSFGHGGGAGRMARQAVAEHAGEQGAEGCAAQVGDHQIDRHGGAPQVGWDYVVDGRIDQSVIHLQQAVGGHEEREGDGGASRRHVNAGGGEGSGGQRCGCGQQQAAIGMAADDAISPGARRQGSQNACRSRPDARPDARLPHRQTVVTDEQGRKKTAETEQEELRMAPEAEIHTSAGMRSRASGAVAPTWWGGPSGPRPTPPSAFARGHDPDSIGRRAGPGGPARTRGSAPPAPRGGSCNHSSAGTSNSAGAAATASAMRQPWACATSPVMVALSITPTGTAIMKPAMARARRAAGTRSPIQLLAAGAHTASPIPTPNREAASNP